MTDPFWTPNRALWFARGLYYMAASDGLVDDERLAIETFARELGLGPQIAPLAVEEFDFDEACRHLDSSWLRRMFVFACRAMVAVDGRVSGVEQETLRMLAQGLGVPENLALEGLDSAPVRPQDMAHWVLEMPIDYVSWEHRANPPFFWAFPHGGHAFSKSAEIHVGPGQALLVHHQGALVDLRGPGAYWLHALDIPQAAEVQTAREDAVSLDFVFARTQPSHGIRWGTFDPIEIAVPNEGTVSIRAFGRLSVQIGDVRAVANRMAHADTAEGDSVENRLSRMLAGRFAFALEAIEWNDRSALVTGLNDLDRLVERLFPTLAEGFAHLGLTLLDVTIENLTGPESLALAPRSRISSQMRILGGRVLGDPPHALSENTVTIDELGIAESLDDPTVREAALHSDAGALTGSDPSQSPPVVRHLSQSLPIGRPMNGPQFVARAKPPARATPQPPAPSAWSAFDEVGLEATMPPVSKQRSALLLPAKQTDNAAQPARESAPSASNNKTASMAPPYPEQAIRQCVRCGSTIPARGRFCPACGEEQPIP